VKERLIGYLKYAGPVGYPLFYVVALLVFASLTFPYRRLKEHIVGQFNAGQREVNGTQELQIDDMSGYWLSGVKLTGVSLLSGPSEPGKPLARIDIDEAAVRYQLLPMLIGHSDLHFAADAFGGEASGSYDMAGKDKEIDLDLDSIDAGKLDPLVAILGVPLGGKLGGKIHLIFPEGKAAKASGSVALEIGGLWIGDGKAKIKNMLALPKIDVGTLTLAAEAKDGVLKLTKLVAGGKDVDVQGDGRVTLRDLAMDSLLDVQIRFRIADAYRGKSDLTKSLFGNPGTADGGILEMADPKVKQSKRPDGFYAWSFRGPLSRPDVAPAGAVGMASPALINRPSSPPASP
jgi:type II secretion system protein N